MIDCLIASMLWGVATFNTDLLDDINIIMMTCIVQCCPAVRWIFHIKVSTNDAHQCLARSQQQLQLILLSIIN